MKTDSIIRKLPRCKSRT